MITIQSAILSGLSSVRVEVCAAPVAQGSFPWPVNVVFRGMRSERRENACSIETRVRTHAALASHFGDLRAVAPWLLVEVFCHNTSGAVDGLDLAVVTAAAMVYKSRAQEALKALEDVLVIGSVNLSGELRPVRGTLAHLLAARESGMRGAIVPRGSMAAASLVARGDFPIWEARSVNEVIAHIDGGPLLPLVFDCQAPTMAEYHHDFREFVGQASAVRAAEIAAAGSHSMLILGRPGSGRTMLARRMTSILPLPSAAEALDIARIADASGMGTAAARPFRAPHYTASTAALVGGGEPLRLGEMSLAQGGALFLDGLNEFRRDALSAVNNVRGNGALKCMPADPMMIAAMDTCACSAHPCTCPKERIASYIARVADFTDTLEIRVRLDARPLGPGRTTPDESQSSAVIRERVVAARTFRADREARNAGGQRPSAMALLRGRPRAECNRAMAVARTIADLDASDLVSEAHMAEAVCVTGGVT